MKNTINRSISCLFALCVMLLLTSFSSWADEPPAGIFGDYSGLGTAVKGKSGTSVYTRKSDRVSVSRSLNGQIRVVIRLTIDKGQVCELDGNAIWKNKQLVLTADGLDETKPCALSLLITGTRLTLRDKGGYCRDVYCGTRGTFDGASFRKK